MPGSLVVGLVEDEPVQAELISSMILAHGMTPIHFDSVERFRRRNGTESVDVLLLDWMLPKDSGIDLLRQLRASAGQQLPIILLTSNSDERDIVYGLNAGADDYIIKPPRAAELAARVRSAHRLRNPDTSATIAEHHPFRVDIRERELFLNGEIQNLTEREFDLIAYFFQRPGRLISRRMLLVDVWGLNPDSNSRSVDTFISRLRKSLGLDGENGWVLQGVYMQGYRLSRSNKESSAEGNLVDSTDMAPES